MGYLKRDGSYIELEFCVCGCNNQEIRYSITHNPHGDTFNGCRIYCNNCSLSIGNKQGVDKPDGEIEKLLISLWNSNMLLYRSKIKPKLNLSNLTIENLSAALNVVHISLREDMLDKVIDIFELILKKGSDTTIGDIEELKKEWGIE